MKWFINRVFRKLYLLIYSLFYKILENILEIFEDIHFKRELDRNLIKKKNREVFDTFNKDFQKSLRFYESKRIQEYAIGLALSNRKKISDNDELFYLEFGVYRGSTANYFSKFVDKLYAFDWFEGLPIEMTGGLPKGSFTNHKKIPRLNSNIELIFGLVEDTLDDFLEEHNPSVNFVHMDLDIYESSLFTLKKLKPYLKKGAIILFDELYNYINWQEGEYKALIETFDKSEFKYRAFNLRGAQVVIEIL